MGMWKSAWTSRECADVNSENIYGMGRLHPLASLQFEMNVLPVKWEAMKRGIEFWVHVMMR